ncbi:choice-of-anchor J domain-containing protein [Fulvivirga sp. 29W222]|uniref:Choice-of-anchor J domain-containing protein n=1 Tax=Fulvivirga marina TaxID=2494733 RepID=A0A937FXF0_9BACT|nr:choice-of-anchor J domain-containing protein [Fulvivirga marina]MBL6446788.1 choice-of-anchor J domain-containing protein [Fulvivirga marina]
MQLKKKSKISLTTKSLFIAGFLLCIATCIPFRIYAQRCATVEYQKLRQEKYPYLESETNFESWLKRKIEERKTARANGVTREEATVYTIPVVVHVIHNGEPLGVGINIPDDQIISQIEVLTEDFRRTNADASNTPAMFLPVAADIELEFTLAKRDPEGLATSGITRINGERSQWSLTDNYELKSLSLWPPEDYLNIWVTDLSGSYLGYAQFPTTGLLAGLDAASESKFTDGVVIDYRAFGSEDKYPPANVINSYNLGRTTTHEVGHFFGLRHIWGDDSGGCSLSDYVDDTPNQGGSTNGCPGTNPESCSSTDMIQNYMDYTDDACMNIFTNGQKARIRTILDNSPRRASLKNSKGATSPVVVNNDLGIREVVSPLYSSCAGSVTPTLAIRNYGNNNITSAEITFQLNGGAIQGTTFILNLAPLEIDTVKFDPKNLDLPGDYNITYEITAVNGVADGNADNNKKSTLINVPESTNIPINENFNALTSGQLPAKWTLQNPDGQKTWELKQNVPNGEGGSNNAFFVNFYDYEVEGDYDTLLTPVLDLSSVAFALLSFDRAYAPYPQVDADGLIIKVSTNCGQSYDYTLYESYGNELATVPETFNYYTPSGLSDWKKECLTLDGFLGNPNVRIAFIARNGYGNNLYIDNISINNSGNTSDRKDLALIDLSRPSKVVCPQEVAPTILVKNQGCTVEKQFTLSYQFDSEQLVTNEVTFDSLKPGQSLEVVLPSKSFTLGEHIYNVELPDTNDINTSNNSLTGAFYVNEEKDELPIREDFENFNSSIWVAVNDIDRVVSWELEATNKGTSIFLSGSGQEGWLVSPTLNLTASEQATLSFDLAYSYTEGSKDNLTILVSTDCGISYEEVIFSKFGEDLSTGSFTSTPKADSVWSRMEVSLSQYLQEDDLRIAFIITKDSENNVYLDNIQTFVTKHNVTRDLIYPNPAPGGIFNISFDLPQKETVEVGIYDTRGQILGHTVFNNTLNQTYTFDYSHAAQGMYFAKVVGESFSYTKIIWLLR